MIRRKQVPLFEAQAIVLPKLLVGNQGHAPMWFE